MPCQNHIPRGFVELEPGLVQACHHLSVVLEAGVWAQAMKQTCCRSLGLHADDHVPLQLQSCQEILLNRFRPRGQQSCRAMRRSKHVPPVALHFEEKAECRLQVFQEQHLFGDVSANRHLSYVDAS